MKYYATKYKNKYVGELGTEQRLFDSVYDAQSQGYIVARTKIPKPKPLNCTFEPIRVFELPRYVEALLESLEIELDRIMWNITQEEYDSPFRNTGNTFEDIDTFQVRAYYWGDDERQIDLPNFKCGDIEISWYKHLGRGATINKPITPEKAIKMYNECMGALQNYEREKNTYF